MSPCGASPVLATGIWGRTPRAACPQEPWSLSPRACPTGSIPTGRAAPKVLKIPPKKQISSTHERPGSAPLTPQPQVFGVWGCPGSSRGSGMAAGMGPKARGSHGCAQPNFGARTNNFGVFW